MYTVLEVWRSNPNFGALDVINYFEKELEIGKNVEILKNEIHNTMRVRQELRVLRAKKLEAEELLKYEQIAIDGEVFMEFPPRKGSDTQREQLRMKLQKENPNFREAKEAFREAVAKVVEKEDELELIGTECKNARRMIELFKAYSAFIKDYKGL